LQEDDREGFAEEFIEHVDRLLIVWKREPAVERLSKFVVHFVTTPDQQKGSASESLFLQLIRHLLEASNANDKAVRFRASDIIASMMNQLDEEAELEYGLRAMPTSCPRLLTRLSLSCSEELWELLLNKMLVRGKDKFPNVRIAAVHSLSRLQDATDDKDPVVSQYIRLLGTDAHKYGTNLQLARKQSAKHSSSHTSSTRTGKCAWRPSPASASRTSHCPKS
jgi:hypothetical protein